MRCEDDVISYINVVTTNNYVDWLKCHSNIICDILGNESQSVDINDDSSIRIISHILKILYNDKIPVINKYYMMISIEEYLLFFVKTESGAIYMVQSLLTDIKNRLNGKWDPTFMCQMLTLICSITVHYDLPLLSNNQCKSLTEGIINLLMEIIIKDMTLNLANLKHTAFCSLLHFESFYPTILLQKKLKIFDLIQKEKSVNFEILLGIYSLIVKNEVIYKSRQQFDNARLTNIEVPDPNSELYNINDISKLRSWFSTGDFPEKLLVSQSHISKSLLNILQDACTHLSPVGINRVAYNCLISAGFLFQQNSLWNFFTSRFIRTNDICILEILLLLKLSSKNGLFQKPVLSDETLQETLFAVINNSLIHLSKRQLVSHWLKEYPFPKQPITVQFDAHIAENHCSLLEPELIRNVFLRSFDSIEIKYCKLMLMSNVIKTASVSDCNSSLLFSSLTELLKNVNYYEPGLFSNILIRVMFHMHINHFDSVLVSDFESIFENLVIKCPGVLSSVVTYLNALDTFDCEKNVSPFSSRCLFQITRLSNEKLMSEVSELNIELVKMHIRILNCAMLKLDMKSYLKVLIDLITSLKIDLSINWLEEACILILELCFNICKNFGSSTYYCELVVLLNEIQSELANSIWITRVNFLYSLIVSLSSTKVKSLLKAREITDLEEDDFERIIHGLIEDNSCEISFVLVLSSSSFTTNNKRYLYDGNISKYFDFLDSEIFPVVFSTNLLLTIHQDFWKEFVYGIEVEFQASLSDVLIKPWNVNFTKYLCRNSCLIENQLEIILQKPQSFSIAGKLVATKLNGIFSIFSIESQIIELFELSLKTPIYFTSESEKSTFLSHLIQNKLKTKSFVSVNFNSPVEYNQLNIHLHNFLFSEVSEIRNYLIFIPPSNHVLLMESCLSKYLHRFDIFTDLNLEELVLIEDHLKNF